MKHNHILPALILSAALSASCEGYLDKSPDMGLTEDVVYSDYESVRGFLDICYSHLENYLQQAWCSNEYAFCGTMSDEMAQMDNDNAGFVINSGNWLTQKQCDTYEIGQTGDTNISRSYKAIRIANRIIANAGRIVNITPEQLELVLGQAHFYRAWFYFQLIKRYGGMPLLDKVYVGDGDDNLERHTYHESHDWMMKDIEIAINTLPMEWGDAEYGRPTRISALAFKEMAMLYDASPLMQNGLDEIEVKDYDRERCKAAARAAQDVLNAIEGTSYRLLPFEKYRDLFYMSSSDYGQDEYLWFNRRFLPSANARNTIRAFWLFPALAGETGHLPSSLAMPTLNAVDMYDRMGPDSLYYPITDPRSGYDLQTANGDAFKNRDPRFYKNIILPGEKWGMSGNTPLYMTLWVGGDYYNALLNDTNSNRRQYSGFMCRKYIWEEANQFQTQWGKFHSCSVFIRLAQVYLDMAEASFEATLSATAVVEGCSLSALQAVNIIRERAGVSPVADDIASDPALFREVIRRERGVELMFENHRWWDIRRWMVAHEIFAPTNPIKGVRFYCEQENPMSMEDKSLWTFRAEPFEMTSETRVFNMRNYWYPFSVIEVNALSKLKQNPGWSE